jgi:hypothetical protein
MDASPFYSFPYPLKFRAIPDSLANEHLEGSECCLIHSDNAKLRREKGIWVNPNVRVSYNASSYSQLNGGQLVKADITDIRDGIEGGDGRKWPGQWEMWKGSWENRRMRIMGWIRVWSEERFVRRRVEDWKEKGRNLNPAEERKEVGIECLVNEMQVLFESGWMHV